MEKSQALQEAIKKFLEENAAKRRELEAIAAPYKKLIAQIESAQKELDQDRADIAVDGYGRTLNPFHWTKGHFKEWRSEEIKREWYSLRYRKNRQDKTISIQIEARPELKKYKFTVTNTAVEKWNGGKCLGVLETYFADHLTDRERQYHGYKQTSEANADQKLLMVERWQCKTKEEAEAKAAELMQAVNRLFRDSKHYKKIVDMVTTEIDQLDTIEVMQ